MALVNEGDPSGLIPEADDDTAEVLGRAADSEGAFMSNFKETFFLPKAVEASQVPLGASTHGTDGGSFSSTVSRFS